MIFFFISFPSVSVFFLLLFSSFLLNFVSLSSSLLLLLFFFFSNYFFLIIIIITIIIIIIIVIIIISIIIKNIIAIIISNVKVIAYGLWIWPILRFINIKHAIDFWDNNLTTGTTYNMVSKRGQFVKKNLYFAYSTFKLDFLGFRGNIFQNAFFFA